MAFVRLLRLLIRDKEIGQRIVPIILDEARNLWHGLFVPRDRYLPSVGQLYESVDAIYCSGTTKRRTQLLEEGITEAGSMASFTAAGTSYATHGEITIPFYSFYSTFGFRKNRRIKSGLGMPAAGGFLMAATAGRTTLNGEGLAARGWPQPHPGDHSARRESFTDPAFAYETAMIIRDGPFRMYEKQEDIFYTSRSTTKRPTPCDARRSRAGNRQGSLPVPSGSRGAQASGSAFGSGSIMRTPFFKAPGALT